MRIGTMIVAWVFLGIVGASLHFGPARSLTLRERAAAELAAIDAAESAAARLDAAAVERTRERVAAKRRLKETNDPRDVELVKAAIASEKAAWTAAREAWTAVAGSLAQVEATVAHPTTQEQTALSLRKARAIAGGGKPGAAAGEIEGALDRLKAAGLEESALADGARSDLADAYYRAALSLRVNGKLEEEWRPLTSTARQQYRYLAEKARAAGNPADADRAERNLEVVLNLEQASTDELEATPTPTECENCKKPGRHAGGKRPANGSHDEWDESEGW